jgi:hypothetical protein
MPKEGPYESTVKFDEDMFCRPFFVKNRSTANTTRLKKVAEEIEALRF